MSATSTIGNYRVIKSIHRIDENNRYSCEFEAVPASLDSIPANQPKAQYADSVVARVKSNEDPLNQGRVQVDLQFASNYNYSWLRVLTPNAGSSTQVSQNRGMVFVPEKGDQVMIGFEYGDPNRPYVMGSLFHGKNGHGGGQNNAEKSIITKSGVQIVFNDNQRSLHIQDPSGNTWDMDGQGNIKVKAPKSIVMDSPQITLNAHKNLSLNVGEYFYSNVGKLTQLHTSTLHQFVSGNISTYSNNSLIHSDTSMKIQSKELSSVGSESLLLHSDKNAVINSKGTAFFHGKDSISHTNNPLNVAMQKTVQIGNVVVEFRPTNTYAGEFGFDWLRVKDTPIGSNDEGVYYHKTPPASFTEDILYAVNIEGEGKFTGNIKNEKIATFYDNIDVMDEEQKYFVPYLNIYPSTARGNPTPPSTATLKLLIRVKDTEPARVQIEFDHLKSYIQIGKDKNSLKDTPYQITDKTVSAEGQKREIAGSIVIKCLKELTGDEYINVYAYPNADNDDGKLLAGRLKILANSKTQRKTQRVLLVPVFLKGEDKDIISITNPQKEEISKFFYQSFIYADIEIYKNKKGEEYLDLSNENEFKPNGRYIKGSKIDVIGSLSSQDNYQNHNIYTYLKNKLTSESLEYEKHLIVFIFGIRINVGMGMAQPILNFTSETQSTIVGVGNCVIIGENKQTSTFPHELGHCLQLWHSFVENDDTDNAKKYVFWDKNKTTNLMSYNHEKRKTTWKWQWEIMQKNVR